MKIMINASTLNAGGGLQVADSICRFLKEYPQHQFIAVLPSMLSTTVDEVNEWDNVKALIYDMGKSVRLLATGRDAFMDGLVEEEHIDAVLTVFGPSRWKPKCLHLCGFARPQLVFKDSPYFKRMGNVQWLRESLKHYLQLQNFKASAQYFWTENPLVSQKLGNLIKGAKVYTASNYFNQVYDNVQLWKSKNLPSFDGITLLTITACYPHKNLDIIPQICEILNREHPDFKYRFVLSVKEEELKPMAENAKKHIVFLGKVAFDECPSLYQQADIMFQPSLLECFTATYPEAMKMDVPIVTTKMEFAEGLCREAALYYAPLSAQEAADAIYRLSTDKLLRKALIEKGKEQLSSFDNHRQRADKLIHIIEELNNNK